MAEKFGENDKVVQTAKPVQSVQPTKTLYGFGDDDKIFKSADVLALEQETKKYEEEVPFLQRVTDPIKAGIARIPGYLPGLEVSSIQKQINAIREGKAGPRDPVTGESLPFQPEEAEAAIKMLQEQQDKPLKDYMSAQAEAGKFRVRPSVASVGNAKTAREAFDLFQVDPLGVMSSVSLESIPQMGPALVLGAVTRNPTVGALAMGSTSFAGELSSGITEYFQDKGVNVRDPVAVNKALNDPILFAKAYEHALTRASIVGTLDTAAAGLASKMLVPKQVIKNQFAKEAVNIGVAQPVAQMISGGGGEALAQIATEGEITKPGQVITEMAGEGPSSVLETAAFGGKEAYDRLKGTQPPVLPDPSTLPDPSAPPTRPTTTLREDDFETDPLDAGLIPPPVTGVTTPPAPPEEGPLKGLTPAEAIIKRLKPEFQEEYFTLRDEAKQIIAKQKELADQGEEENPSLNIRLEEILSRFDEFNSDKQYRKPIFTKSPNDPAIEKEALALADELEKAGDTISSDGLRSNISNTGGYTDLKKLDYYKGKLLEAQQKAGVAEEMPKETVSMANYMGLGYETDAKRVDEFLNKPTYYKKLNKEVQASQEVRDIFAKSNKYLQKLTDRINELGYTAMGRENDAPKEVKDLRTKLSEIAGSINRLIKEDEGIIKELKHKGYENRPQQRQKSLKLLAKDFSEVDSLIGKNVEEEKPKTELQKVMENEEKLESPTISKKSVIPHATVYVAPYKDGFVSGFQYYGGNKSQVNISTPLYLENIYPTRQEAIDVAAKEIRGRAEEDKNKVALTWLDTVSTPAAPVTSVAPIKPPVEQIEQRELERRDDENQIGKPTLQERLNLGLNPIIDSRDEAGKITYYAKGLGSTDPKYQVKLDLTPEELRAAKIAEGNIDLAETLEERQAAKNELEEVLKPAAERAVSVETPLEIPKEEKKPTKEEQIEINKARQEEKFKAAAEVIGNDQKLLEKKLKEAKSVLTNEYQEKFKNPTFDFKKKQLISADGKLALQWENNGKTNQGDVKVIPIKEGTQAASTPTQAEINRERQAEKKAKTEKAIEVKPKIEDIVSPEVASAMKDIEFQKKLIKANNEKSITEAQFSKVFNLQQSGKTAEADAQLTKILEKKEKKNKEEHIEGNTSEPITSKTIEEAIDKADDKVDAKKIKQAIKNQFDQAIKRAKLLTEKDWSDAKELSDIDAYVTISIPGDGKFKVKNNKERLEEVQKKLTAALPLKEGKPKREVSAVSVSSAETAFKAMVDDKDMENAIEYAKLQNLDIKQVKLNPTQKATLDNYLKNPAEFQRQQEEAESLEEARTTALRTDQEKRARERLAEDEKREEEARFQAVLDTTIRSTESQLKGDIAKRKITSMDAARMLEVIPDLPTGTVKPYVTKELTKIAEKKSDVAVDDEGEKLSFPLFVDMANKGYKILGSDNSRTYETKGGKKYRTIEKDGVRLAVNPGEIIFADPKYPNRSPQLGYGESNQVTWHFIDVDKDQRKQGKATQAIKDFMEVADKNGYTVYGEPAQLEEGGMTAEQLSQFYSKFGFQPSEISKKVIIRNPQITDESRTIDVEAVDITPAQVKLLTNQVNKLSDADIAALEEHYGVANYSSDFMKRIREDVVTYINKGADAVDAAIRSIIAKLQAGLLSVAVVFNPATFQTPDFNIPRFIEETRTVSAPAPQRAEMSAVANKAYSITAPAFIKANQAFFIADKPNGKIHLFDTDGKFLKSSDALYGKQAGDILTAEAREKSVEKTQDIDKVTPAGTFKLSVAINPDYTGGYVLRFTDNKGDMGGVAIHAVYTGDVKENREAKMASKDPKDKKITFGCINVDTSFFTGNIIPRIDKMENAGVVVIPDAQEQLDLFVKPTTEKVSAPAKEVKTEERTKIVGRETPYYNDFTSNIDESYFDKQVVKTREEKVTDYAQARAATRRLTKKVAKYGSDIPLQRELNTLLEVEQDLKNYLDMTKPVRNTAQDFMARATKELADENIAPEVEAFIRNAFEKNPALLQGLRLSVRSQGAAGRDAGNFNPYTRIVTLWKDGSGVEDAKTIRHELTHSLEQMMLPETKKILVDQWGRALEKAMKENVDQRSKDYFDAVLKFLENPSKETFDAATKIMPSYDFYQFINPSEYWAVNAEAMLGAKLGGPWTRFTNAIKKILEGLKSFFGMDNNFVIHQAMDKILSGEMKRLDKSGLTDYLFQGKYKINFLNNIKDLVDIINKYDIPETPKVGLVNFKDKLVDSYKDFRNFKDALISTPIVTSNKMIGSANDVLLHHRNKNVFFGAGLQARDVAKYKGQLADAQGQAIGSVALINAIHSGHMLTEVMVQGKMEFSKATQMFGAAESKTSIANILKAQDKFFNRVGKKIGATILNAYTEAKRVRSIYNELIQREAVYQQAIASGQSAEDALRDYQGIRIAYDKIPDYFLVKDKNGKFETTEIKDNNGNVIDTIRVVNDDVVDDLSNLEKTHPELREVMDNWKGVNHNTIDNMVLSGLVTEARGNQLKSIDDYVPWQRIRDDMEDVHTPFLGVSGLTNVSQEKRFKKGFVESKVDDIVHNMIVNTMMLNRNSVRNHAINTIARAYATRGKTGKIKIFPQGTEGVTKEGYIRANFLLDGKRRVIEFQDPLVAESVLGMETMDIPMINALGIFAQGLRRGITSNPLFQIFQVFKDAPQAAAVTAIDDKGAFSSIKNPMMIYFGVLHSFFMALNPNDEIVKIFKSYGIGGFQSSYRTPEKELALKIGLQRKSFIAGMLKVLDFIGDASDYAQRRAVYNRVYKATGNQMLALVQANNVIDFLKHGSGKLAIAQIRTVSFMNAYAQSMDVLATAMAGGGLKGVERAKASRLFYTTTLLFAATTLVYCFLQGENEEYDKLDDQTKFRNYIIGPIKIPAMTSYSFFFKTLVEAAYYKITREGTKNEMDYQRLKKGLSRAAADALLGPNMTPSGVKPVLEIILDRNFFTGGSVVPRGLENLESFQQWNATTSELGKVISAATGGILNPIQADHLMKGLTGTVGLLVMAGSDLFTNDKPAKNASQNPLFGPYVLSPEPRLREDLFYTFKEETDRVYDTFIKMQKRQIKGDAKKYFEDNKELIKGYGFTSRADAELKRINAEIRRVGELPGEKMAPEAKRDRINELQGIKNRVLKGVIDQRIKAGMNKYPWED